VQREGKNPTQRQGKPLAVGVEQKRKRSRLKEQIEEKKESPLPRKEPSTNEKCLRRIRKFSGGRKRGGEREEKEKGRGGKDETKKSGKERGGNTRKDPREGEEDSPGGM
jgi:hypothetical protein